MVMDLLEKVRGRRQGVLEVVKARRSSRGRMVHELKFKADGGLNGWVTTSAPGSSLLWQNRRQFAQSCSGWRPRQRIRQGHVRGTARRPRSIACFHADASCQSTQLTNSLTGLRSSTLPMAQLHHAN
ncbi:hypothetical protein VPH35_111940 [Triticum aestivum]